MMTNMSKSICGVCSSPCQATVSTYCCDSTACRTCAVSYITRTGRCWAVDCGTPCAVSDLAAVSTATASAAVTATSSTSTAKSSASTATSSASPATSSVSPVGHSEITSSSRETSVKLLTCELCDSLCKRGVVTSCCKARSCRGCGVKYVTQNRKCWGEGCSKTGLKTADLDNDQILRDAVDEYIKNKEVSQEMLEKLSNNIVEDEIQIISENGKDELQKMNVSPMKEIPLKSSNDEIVVLESSSDSAQKMCDKNIVANEVIDKGGGKAGSKREAEENGPPVCKKSKFDQICTTVGNTSLYSQFPNTVLVKLSLADPCNNVKIVFSKDFLKFLRLNNCILAEKCINQKSRVLAYKGNFYTFIQISFKHVKSSSFDLDQDFHIANFSRLGEKNKTEFDFQMNIHVDCAITVDQTPKICKVFLSSSKKKIISKNDILSCNFYITEYFNDKLEIVSLVFKPAASYRLGSDSTNSSDVTAEILIKSRNKNTVTLTSKQLIAEAKTCSDETDFEQVLHLCDCFDDGIEIIDGSVQDKNWVANLDDETKKRLAEKKKLEGNSLFAKRIYKNAIKKYSDAIDLDETNGTYYSNRAACYICLKDPANALKDALKSVEIDPTFAKGWVRAAKCYIMVGDILKAKEMCGKVIELSSSLNILVNEEVQKIKHIEVLHQEFLKAYEKGYFLNAIHHLNNIAEICPRFKKNHLLRAELLALKGEFVKCNALLDENFDADDNCSDVLYVKALVSYYQDNFDVAFKILNSILELDPDHQKSKKCLELATSIKEKKDEGNTYFKDGKYEEANKLYTEALEIDKFNILTNAKLYYNRATVHVKLGKLSEAIEDCTKAIQLDKTYQKPYLRRAQAFMEIESFDQAVKDYEQLVRLDKTKKEYRDLLKEANEKLRLSKNKDFYKLLGVEKKASQEDIKKAYRKAALIHHPDRHSVAEEGVKLFHLKKFKDIGEAYGILSDETKRAMYDKGILYQSIQAQNSNTAQATRMAHTAAFWASMGAAAQARMQAAQQAQAQMTAAAAAAAAAAAQASNQRPGLAGVRPGFVFLPRMGNSQNQRVPLNRFGGIPPYGLPARFPYMNNFRF